MKNILKIVVKEAAILVMSLLIIFLVVLAIKQVASANPVETELETETEDDGIYDELLYSEGEVDSMAHLIMGEAEGGSWDLKLGVGTVVLNRVMDDRFPSSVDEVIFQSGQYSCTWDGRYYLEPNEECWEAARWLLKNGPIFDREVVWQAEFPQGNYVYDRFEGMYFCG